MVVSDAETVVSEPKRTFPRQNDCFGRRMGTKTKGYENQCQRRAKFEEMGMILIFDCDKVLGVAVTLVISAVSFSSVGGQYDDTSKSSLLR